MANIKTGNINVNVSVRARWWIKPVVALLCFLAGRGLLASVGEARATECPGAGAPLSSHDEFVRELMRCLGLPPRVSAFTLHAETDSLVTVDCTYFPEVKSGRNVTERFTFAAKGEWELP